jgi:hypothetical protein
MGAESRTCSDNGVGEAGREELESASCAANSGDEDIVAVGKRVELDGSSQELVSL